jgi:GNAT superfamily N-acetyltransferase
MPTQNASTTIRRLRADDRTAWDAIWRDYCAFYRAQITAETTATAFARLCTGEDMVGIVARDADGLVGLAHLVFHRSTWTIGDICYLEDLFVVPRCRGGGVARDLIEHAYAEADRRGASRVYWHTQEYNAPARSLYDSVAKRTSQVVYRR